MTNVVFRKFKDDGEIIALFPGIRWNPPGYDIASYMHIGQHGGADYGHVVSISQPAKPEEYKELLAELVGIGYGDLRVKQKCRPKF